MFARISETEFNAMHKVADAGHWEKNLAQFSDELILSGVDAASSRARAVFKTHVDIVNLELSSRCNRKCIYCPVATWSREEQQFMNDSVFEQILADLCSVDYSRTISLNLYNEPFADIAEFLGRLTRLRSALPDAVLYTNSNGDFITRDVLEAAESAGLQKLKITIHPPRLKTWNRSRERRSLLAFLQKLGVVDSNRADVDEEYRVEAYFKVAKLAVIVQSVDWQREGNARAGSAEAVLNVLSERSYPCIKPIREVTVFYDGTITMCCDAFYDEEFTENRIARIGNGTSLLDAYFSDELGSIRKNLLGWNRKSGPCRNCAVPDSSSNESADQRVMRDRILGQVSGTEVEDEMK